jgi:hypothetical protein
VRRTTRWGRPSPEMTVSRTARNAGAEIDGGSSVPPARTENVAGTRTFTDPPAGFLAAPGEAPPLTGAPPLPEPLAPAPLEAPAPPEAPPPPLAVVLPAVVEPLAVVRLLAVGELVAGLATAADCTEEAAGEPVAELAAWFDPPHAPIARQQGTSASRATRGLTSSA